MFSSQSQMESGLMRFRSAPSSFLETLMGGAGDEFHQPPAPENLMGRFFSGDSSCLTSESSCRVAISTGLDLEEIEPSLDLRASTDPKKSEGLGGFSEPESALKRAGSNGGGGGSGRFSHLGHVGMSNFTASSHDKTSLARQTSTPAGFLTNPHLGNGYSLGGGIGPFSLDHCSSGAAQRRLKSQLSFSGSHDHVSPKGGGIHMQSLQLSEDMQAEVGESMATAGGSSSEDGGSLGAVNKSFLSTGFPLTTSWDDSHRIVFGGGGSRKRGRDLNVDLIHGLEDPQFDLSKSSLDVVSMEKLLQIPQDSVPCKIRAKRGCATHPRSIAERERRTRISEKLRKLQELVPNMDKQTNTADMLNLAVQYIKTLQNEVQKFTKERANCTCSSKRDAKS